MKINTAFIGADGKEHHLEISQATGGGDSYQVHVDNRYCGSIVWYNLGGWTWVVERDSLFYSDDIGAIMDMIKEKDR